MPLIDTALQKRVKRHVIGRTHTFFAVTPPGLENICRRELTDTCGTVSQATAVAGGVEFQGRLTDLYSASLDLHIPTRILMRLAMFKATNFRQLEKQLDRLPWELHLPPDATLKVSVKTAHSRLYHTAAIARQVGKCAVKRLGTVSLPPSGRNDGNQTVQTLYVRGLDDNFLISLDTSGAPLYKRGLKTDVGQAPLRENLAAAALFWAGYRGGEALLDPMCGSGTFSLEAAMMSSRTPPGWHRTFAFTNWPAFKPKQWQYLKKVRAARIRPPEHATVFASDTDPRACETLESVIKQHDLTHAVTVNHADFFSLNPGNTCPKPGLVALNPPYGIRLGSVGENEALYAEIAEKLTKDFKKWRVALILPDKRLATRFPSRLRSRKFSHGGLSLTLLTGKIL